MFSLIKCAIKGCKVSGMANEMLIKHVNGIKSYVCWNHEK